jgi:hypothetical protein
MLRDYSTSASLTPSCFLHCRDLVGHKFFIKSLLDLHVYSSSFLDHRTSHPARHDIRYYSMSASLMPSEMFSSSFRYIRSLLPIGCHSTSPCSAKTTNRSAAKLTFFLFSFGPTRMLFDPSRALRLHHDLSMVATPTPRWGACETWVPLGPHRLGSRSSPTSGVTTHPRKFCTIT